MVSLGAQAFALSDQPSLLHNVMSSRLRWEPRWEYRGIPRAPVSVNIGGPEPREALSKAAPASYQGGPRREPLLLEGGEILPGWPNNHEVNSPSMDLVVLRSQKKKKFQAAPVEAIPEHGEEAPKRIGDCVVFRSAARWTIRLKKVLERPRSLPSVHPEGAKYGSR